MTVIDWGDHESGRWGSITAGWKFCAIGWWWDNTDGECSLNLLLGPVAVSFGWWAS